MVTRRNESWWTMTHSYHDSFLRVTSVPWLIPTLNHRYKRCWAQWWWRVMRSWVSCHTYGCDKSHIWMSHFTHMDASCHTYGWVMSHIWMSHVTHMDASCHTYGWVMVHIWMSHVTHMDESQHTYGRVMSHIWMSHVPHIDTSCHTYGW